MPAAISLRSTQRADVPTLYRFQLDSIANQLAGTKPRDEFAFTQRWDLILRDPSITPHVILLDGAVVGSIDCFQYEGPSGREGPHFIGYWIDRAHWGRGIATRAIGLFLAKVPMRPLRARVAAHNTPSLRALARHGFTEISRELTPETDRTVARDTITLLLE